MNSNLTQALAWIDIDEGPELNVGASEPGGSSKHGVSMTVLQEWHKEKGLPPPTMDDMAAVDSVLAGQIYTEKFATPVRFNDLPGGADYRMLDIAVNLGPTGAITGLQMCLLLWPITGVLDDATMAAANKVNATALVAVLSAFWISKKHEAASWPTYGHGWMNRNIRATSRAVSLITA